MLPEGNLAGRYLVKKRWKKKPPVAHIWEGNDTRCRMWSTGGIVKKDRYEVVATTDHEICQICREAGDRLIVPW